MVNPTRQGDTLIVGIEQIDRIQEILYQGTDLKHYQVVPTDRDNELVALRLNVHNAEATRVLLTVDNEAARLRFSEPTGDQSLLDIAPENPINVSVTVEAHPDEDQFAPFLAGPFELLQGFGIAGWVVFEVPKGAKLQELRWSAADNVCIPLVPGNDPCQLEVEGKSTDGYNLHQYGLHRP